MKLQTPNQGAEVSNGVSPREGARRPVVLDGGPFRGLGFRGLFLGGLGFSILGLSAYIQGLYQVDHAFIGF